MTESLPSGVLRLNAFLDQFDEDEQERLCRYALDHIVPAMKAKRLAALASPPPQATGALNEDARDAARYRTLRHSLSGEAGCSHTQMPTIQDPRNSMLTYLPHGLDQALDAIIAERAASQVEPEEKHG